MKTQWALALVLVCGLCAHKPGRAQGAAKTLSNAQAVTRSVRLCEVGKFAEAKQVLEGQIKREKSAKGKGELQNALADVHFRWARQREAAGDSEGAIAHHMAAYASDKTLRRQSAAYDLANVAVVYDNLSRSADALRYYNLALAICREVKDRAEEAALLNNIGATNWSVNRYEEALRSYNLALPIYRELKNQNGEATLLISMGTVYEALSRHEEALSAYNRALPIYRAIKARKSEATTLNKMGTVYSRLSRQDEALRYYNLSLPIYHEVKERLEEATALNNIGLVYWSLSRSAEALRYYNLALPIYREVKDASGEATTLNNIGMVYWSLGRHEDALRHYNLALPILRTIKDRKSEATALNNIGAVYERMSRYEDALRSYSLALPILREVKDRAVEATTLDNIGLVYDHLGRYDDALQVYNRALPICREIKYRALEANTLNNMGVVYDHLGRSEDALRYYNLTLPICREVQDRSGEAATLNNMMAVYETQKQLQPAILMGKQGVNVLQSIRRDNAGLDRGSQQAYLKANKGMYERLSALLIEAGRLPEAEQISRMLKQSETFDFVRRDAAQGGTGENLSLSPLEQQYITRYNQLGAEAATVGERIAELEKVPEETRTKEQEAALDKLYNDREAVDGRFEVFRKELVAAFGGVTSDLNTVDVAASDAWQKALTKVSNETGKTTALLTTVVAPDTFYVILTTPTARLRFSAPIKSGDLNALVNRFRLCLTNPHLDPKADAQKLWSVVFCNGELETALQKANVGVALWSLGGSLRYVPIDALHDGMTYLVARKRLNVVMTTTSKDYFEAPQGGKALAVGTSGAFDVSLKDASGGSETLSFSALSQVPQEVRGIIHDEANGGTGPLDGRILLENNFNETQLQSQLRRGFATVHVATHFRLQPGDAQKSFLLLGDGNPLAVLDWKVKMPLKSVELLTLSACETGLGAETSQAGAAPTSPGAATGAEVSSLGEVAQLQGASAVVVSLWSVADSSTSLLMRDFYAKWRQNPADGKGEALRAAQRALLGVITPVPGDEQRGMRMQGGPQTTPTFAADPQYPFAHPFYWAPFTLIGNWR